MPEQMTAKWSGEKTVMTDRGPIKVRVRCNALNAWTVTRSYGGVPSEWSPAVGEVADLISRIVEGDQSAWRTLAVVEFPQPEPPE